MVKYSAPLNQFIRIACQNPWSSLKTKVTRVTLTFKLLTTKLTVSCPCPIDHLCQLASKSVHLFSKYRVDKLGETNERMDERTDNVRT